MNKTLALLLDSYRELNAKRLFWIVLVISALVVGAFSMVGVKNGAITVLWWDTPFKDPALTMLKPAMLYKLMFSYFGVGFWLSWLANILALVSTAGIFPDFMAGGSIDLYLSKPLSRIRLFLTKYTGGLLFVTLQVSVFSVCSFLLIGLRGHQWEPSIFLAIPLVVLTFSYLFSVCVLLGILTRSTIAALLLTLLVWFCIWGVQTAEASLMVISTQQEVHAQSLDRRIAQAKEDLADFPTTKPTTGTSQPTTSSRPRHSGGTFGLFSHHDSKTEVQARLDSLQTERQNIGTGVHTAHTIVYSVFAPMPKTGATIELLDRQLIKRADLPKTDNDDGNDSGFGENRSEDRHEVRKRVRQAEESRSAIGIIGTSLAFEAVIMAWAAWVFCRRDY